MGVHLVYGANLYFCNEIYIILGVLENEAAGHVVDYWFADTISGGTSATQRPLFAARLGQIRNGETLAFAKLDRLCRDAQDIGATVKLQASRKISVIALQLGKLDLTSRPAR